MAALTFPAGVPIPFGPTAAGVQLGGGGFALVGWAVENTDLALPARLVLRDGGGAAGLYLVPITLAAGESRDGNAPGRAILVESGLFVDVTLGTVAGALFVVPVAQVMRGGALVTVALDRYGEFVTLDDAAAATAEFPTGGVPA